MDRQVWRCRLPNCQAGRFLAIPAQFRIPRDQLYPGDIAGLGYSVTCLPILYLVGLARPDRRYAERTRLGEFGASRNEVVCGKELYSVDALTERHGETCVSLLDGVSFAVAAVCMCRR